MTDGAESNVSSPFDAKHSSAPEVSAVSDVIALLELSLAKLDALGMTVAANYVSHSLELSRAHLVLLQKGPSIG